jgi:hypothetical protein
LVVDAVTVDFFFFSFLAGFDVGSGVDSGDYISVNELKQWDLHVLSHLFFT